MSISKITACISLVLVILAGIFLINIRTESDILKQYEFNTGEQNITFAGDIQSDFLLIGTGQNNLLAYNSYGEIKWKFSAAGLFKEVLINEFTGEVFAGNEDRNIYVLNLDNGKLLRTIQIPGKLFDMDLNQKNGQLIVSSGISAVKHYLSLFNGSGIPIWEKNIEIISRSTVIYQDKIIYGTDRAELVLSDIRGNEIKKMKLDGQIIDLISSDRGEIACLTERGSLYFLDFDLRQTGGLQVKGEAKKASVLWDQNRVFIGMKNGSLHILEKSGHNLKTVNFPFSISGIYACEQSVKVLCRDGFLYTMDNSDIKDIPKNRLKMTLVVSVFVMLLIVFITTLFFIFPAITEMFSRFFCTLFKHRTAYIMLLPIFFLLILFHYYPVVIAMIRSFTDWNVHSEKINFNGLDNFRLMINEGYFLAGVKNLGILCGMAFIKLFTMPLLAAKLVFHLQGRFKRAFRLMFVLPMIVPGIVVALVWQNIYDPNIGLLNNLLEVLNLEHLQQVWLGNEKTAIWSIVFMGFPFVDAFAFLVYYGGLINISSELFEASNLDGANGWWNFWKIEIPMITPQIKMLIILIFIGVVQDFAPILILTGGGPGISTYVPGLELYYNITRFGRYGYASALGLVMFIFIFAGTLLNLRIKTSSDNEL
ncbi:MAG: ABC transporter permease subunit [Spirochaetaceae bacterium]